MTKFQLQAAIRLQACGDMIAYKSAQAVDTSFSKVFNEEDNQWVIIGNKSNYLYTSFPTEEEADAEIERMSKAEVVAVVKLRAAVVASLKD